MPSPHSWGLAQRASVQGYYHHRRRRPRHVGLRTTGGTRVIEGWELGRTGARGGRAKWDATEAGTVRRVALEQAAVRPKHPPAGAGRGGARAGYLTSWGARSRLGLVSVRVEKGAI